MPRDNEDDKSKTQDPSKDPKDQNAKKTTKKKGPQKGDNTKQSRAPISGNPHTTSPTNHADPKQVGKDEAKAATEAGGPLPHGVLPDQVQINQNLGQLSSDLNAFADRVEFMLAGTEHAPLTKILVQAQDYLSKELGLVKRDDGSWAAAGSNTATPDQSVTST